MHCPTQVKKVYTIITPNLKDHQVLLITLQMPKHYIKCYRIMPIVRSLSRGNGSVLHD